MLVSIGKCKQGAPPIRSVGCSPPSSGERVRRRRLYARIRRSRSCFGASGLCPSPVNRLDTSDALTAQLKEIEKGMERQCRAGAGRRTSGAGRLGYWEEGYSGGEEGAGEVSPTHHFHRRAVGVRLCRRLFFRCWTNLTQALIYGVLGLLQA
jgi:hypothetical protein